MYQAVSSIALPVMQSFGCSSFQGHNFISHHHLAFREQACKLDSGVVEPRATWWTYEGDLLPGFAAFPMPKDSSVKCFFLLTANS